MDKNGLTEIVNKAYVWNRVASYTQQNKLIITCILRLYENNKIRYTYRISLLHEWKNKKTYDITFFLNLLIGPDTKTLNVFGSDNFTGSEYKASKFLEHAYLVPRGRLIYTLTLWG